jgi:hypothetical protein
LRLTSSVFTLITSSCAATDKAAAIEHATVRTKQVARITTSPLLLLELVWT